jgi:flagellar basal body-associated protein FliL
VDLKAEVRSFLEESMTRYASPSQQNNHSATPHKKKRSLTLICCICIFLAIVLSLIIKLTLGSKQNQPPQPKQTTALKLPN